MIVGAVIAVLLTASVVLVAQLRTLDADRAAGRRTLATALGATAVRVGYSILVVAAFAILPLAWAIGALPTAGLLAFLTAPLAIRLGDTVSHRSGTGLDSALGEAIFLGIAFIVLLVFGFVLSE